MKYSFNKLAKKVIAEFSKTKNKTKYIDKIKEKDKELRRKVGSSAYIGNKYNLNKSYLRKMDSSGGTWHVRFFKVDGTVRDMLCTRDWNKLKKDKYQGYVEPAGTSGRIIPSHQVIVWDTQAKGFRSFRANSVLLFEKVSDNIASTYNNKVKYSRKQLIDKLDKENLKITFIKRDGTKRIMNCTRNIKDFEDDYVDHQNLIRVWDLDKNDYRTIIYSTIQSVDKSTKNYKKI